ncbi:uncharacterized protein [Littorina saxatilis]|uniref:uncharacterized protein n=1 Tax=Littorina saxatilis TaxID=31220 RepID=UPI0038B5B6D9
MVITGRPRAHSASSIKLNQVLQLDPPILASRASPVGTGKKLSYSSPELRSMLVGLETTVPQNLNPSHLGSRHKPRPRRGKMGSRVSLQQIGRGAGGGSSQGLGDDEGQCCGECCLTCCGGCCLTCCGGCCADWCSPCCCGGGGGGGGGGDDGQSCCRVHIFLVLMQLLAGAGVTAVSVYMYLFLPVFITRETPIWAGAPDQAYRPMGSLTLYRTRPIGPWDHSHALLDQAYRPMGSLSRFTGPGLVSDCLSACVSMCQPVSACVSRVYGEKKSKHATSKKATPLCLAGILGIYFCATNFKDYSKTTRAFVLKVLCSILSAISIVVCVTAAIFSAIHLGRIFTYVSCKETEDDCHCFLLQDGDDFLPRVFTYPGIQDCFHVFCEVKIYLLVVGSLCLAGSLFSLWFAILLWKARYGRFHSGVRLPSVRRQRYSNPNP